MPEIPIKEALNKAFTKVRPERASIEKFKANFITLLDGIGHNPKESEEFLKNLVSDFLKNTWYAPDYFINTHQRVDLVIHTGNDTSPVGVIIEAKKPGNKNEMVSRKNLNAKAMRELLLYYFRETIDNANVDLKHLIITNTIEWFIFDAREFHLHFSRNKKLVGYYNDFSKGTLLEKDTEYFYNSIAAPYIEEAKKDIEYTYFNIQDYEEIIRHHDREADNKLISLYKILSPNHLLKKSFVNDSNVLNQNFYFELLYLIGLTENKEENKKVIVRNEKGKRQAASLVENTIFQISDDIPDEDILFEIALDLNITWIDRILFLKLLEAQQLQYQGGNRDYAFLNIQTIKTFNELNTLFFKVLAVEPKNREDTVREKFRNIPYLNSSLFEKTDNERDHTLISNLQNEAIDIFPGTVLKDETGNKRKGKINILEYIFAFLDAYDFSSEGSEQIQEQNKTLINASVLGLIFEKINGYKDGSYFTPGFITSFICSETIKNVVIGKFNMVKGWKADTIKDIYNKIETEDIDEADKIINSITILDPAVGSGHFLVSALNEIIAIKSELGILTDSEGKRIRNEIKVLNDELVVYDEAGEYFEYNYKNKESQRIQETLFQEKRRIIENCLFGVDLNRNSVKICRLRLWIELLKNAYYTKESGYKELETLPNLDINIKPGNSLISRFDLNVDFRNSTSTLKYTIKDYREAVQNYKHSNNKDDSKKLLDIISKIKTDFSENIQKQNSLFNEKANLENRMAALGAENIEMDFVTDKQLEEKNKKIEKLKNAILEKQMEIDAFLNGVVYDDAFEWRFEFPEVLTPDGNFTGFDAVIGNPPYGIEIDKKFFQEKYKSCDDIYTLFLERGHTLGNANSFLSFIMPIFWLTGDAFNVTRRFLYDNMSLVKGVILPYDVFPDAYIDTGVFIFANNKAYHTSLVYDFKPRDKVDSAILSNAPFYNITEEDWDKANGLKLIFDPISRSLHKKFKRFTIKIDDVCKSARGILADKSLYLREKAENTVPAFVGKLTRYSMDSEFNYIVYDNSIKEKPTTYAYFKDERILVRRIVNRQFRIMATIKNDEFVVKKDIYIFKPNNPDYSAKLILAIINSKLISYMLTKASTAARKDDFTQITLNDIRNIRIPTIAKQQIEVIEDLVDKVLAAKTQDSLSDTVAYEKEIDDIVYSLYQLTPEEIEIVDRSR